MTDPVKSKESASAGTPAEGSMFLYQKPEYLDRAAHEKLGWTMPKAPYAFAAKIISIPLVISEIPSAQKFYPIVFSGFENSQPLAVFSTEQGNNPFVSDDGIWESEYYIPAYLRRYPFATVQGENDQVAVVIDRASDGILENSDLPFFEDGSISKAAQSMVDFSVQYERDRKITQDFMRTVLELGLLSEQRVGQSINGENKNFANYISIDGDKLDAFSSEQLASLHEKRYLGFIYGQLFSQENWTKLIARIPAL
jgi:hypothetical protein